MRKTMAILAAAVFLAALPLSHAVAMDHGKSGDDQGSKKMDHRSMKMDHGSKKMDHGAHAGAGHEKMVMVGMATIHGVKGEAHLNDVRDAMKKAGMNATHHFMVVFEDMGSKNAITEGTVAVKVMGPDGKSGNPVRLVGMDGHFGADIVLDQKGEYVFEVGTRLPDGQTRQFEFRHKIQ